jgi:hypothetical protein
MADTNVSFTTDEGELLANYNWLPLIAGDTISFEAPTTGPQPVLFFSPDLAKVLTPTPSNPVTIGNAAPLVFTVGAAQPGAYTIVVASSPEIPPYFPDRSSTSLFFESTPIPVGFAPVDPPPRSGNRHA